MASINIMLITYPTECYKNTTTTTTTTNNNNEKSEGIMNQTQQKWIQMKH